MLFGKKPVCCLGTRQCAEPYKFSATNHIPPGAFLPTKIALFEYFTCFPWPTTSPQGLFYPQQRPGKLYGVTLAHSTGSRRGLNTPPPLPTKPPPPSDWKCPGALGEDNWRGQTYIPHAWWPQGVGGYKRMKINDMKIIWKIYVICDF